MGLDAVLARLRAAEAAAGREAGAVQLVAVSKEQPEARVRAVLASGHRCFGENRVQEAEARWAALEPDFPGVELHLIGPLQTNKARAAVARFAVIQSLDRPRLARTLADLAQARGACPRLYVQVNTGAEPQKAGVLPGEADAFLADVRRMSLPVEGLMCIPPVDSDPVPHFRLLRSIALTAGLAGLSMGMSDDFEIAVAEGATVVRVGSAIFGSRAARGALSPG
ncbi:MAG: YggS family pyridoxal phosphate-dependent enzyme [Rhodobacteraceae bacterium]|jgi:pyridoxal phosphate enzyme (YggS family)|nr:YggS family pyridoxal phosphate-dependent enzyme [Paracoccaceae bacterium]